MPLKAPERESRITSSRPSVIAVRGLSKTFAARGGPVPALRDVSFDVARGETLGIIGPSGCGKSTLLEVLCGLEPASAGAVSVSGGCVLMPQRDLLLPWRSALDNAALAGQLQGASRAEARRRAAALFERFGLAEFAQARPAELSGGMRQRVAFARTLLADRPVVLLDEPFASLDSITRAELQEWLLAALDEEPRTTLFVTHDIEEALFLCDRVLVLSRRPGTVTAELDPGLDRSGPRTDVVTSDRFSQLRRQALEALG
jgi:NitT/TauT family transport system ATP-binding protein